MTLVFCLFLLLTGYRNESFFILAIALRAFLTFQTSSKRWIVERTFGWLNRYRRLSKDYELHNESSEAMIYGSLIRLMTRRLAA